MKSIKYFFIFLISISICKAQITDSTQKSIENEITTYQNKDLMFISNARLILAEAIKNEDFAKAKTTFKLLIEKYDLSNYMPFAPQERLSLSFLTEEYGVALTDFAKNLNNISTSKNDKIIGYKNDGLTLIAFSSFKKRKDELIKRVPQNTLLKEDDKAFVILLYKSIVMEDRQVINQANLEKTNTDADEFIEKFPESVYTPFVKSEMKEVYEDAKVGFMFDVFVTQFGISPDFKKYFNTTGLGGGLGLHVLYKNWIFSLGSNVNQGLTRTNETLLVNGKNWTNDIKGSIVNVEIGAGYNIISSKRFRIYPYAAISYNGIVPLKQENRDLSQYRGDGFAVGVGSIIDYAFSIGKPKIASALYGYNTIGRSNLGIRLKGMYVLPSVPIKELTQSYTYINIGLYWEARTQVRKRF
jgi:outer membrane protein assembly factor BamD (BamD/ComL family)